MSETNKSEINNLLSRWFHCGEEVVITAQDNKGVVMGFGESFIPRGGHRHKLAGRYVDFCKLKLRKHRNWEDARVQVEDVRSFHYSPERKAICEQMRNLLVKTGDLPETPFWEGDFVSFKREACVGSFADEIANVRHTVMSIKYGTGAVDDFKVHLMSPSGSGGGPISKIRLFQRGNIWKLAHDEPLDFTDIEEGAKFFQMHGMSHKLEDATEVAMMREHGESIEFRDSKEEARFYSSRGESHGANYVTDLTVQFTDAIRTIQQEKADEMKLKDKKKLTYVLIKYDDPSFSLRMREHTLKHYGVWEQKVGCEA